MLRDTQERHDGRGRLVGGRCGGCGRCCLRGRGGRCGYGFRGRRGGHGRRDRRGARGARDRALPGRQAEMTARLVQDLDDRAQPPRVERRHTITLLCDAARGNTRESRTVNWRITIVRAARTSHGERTRCARRTRAHHTSRVFRRGAHAPDGAWPRYGRPAWSGQE
ncbi:hypothetical protein DCW30_27185 [Streptomyces alfalfae]|nr:hypothetical protein D3X13_08265 [Streptomyces fradiae]RXX38202.1 hypothetical protein DCW30_27185 [Streptomyces alfalfae]RZM95936.1 hypothetical protein D4104_16245 [Streptomyces alfalfae]